MSAIQVEVGENAELSRCKCCGEESKTGHGFIYSDGDARAVYYVGWTPAHVERGVHLAIAIGDWGDDATAKDRVCFGVEAFEGEREILFRFAEPEDSPWSDTELLGRMMERTKALEHPLSKEALRIAEAIVTEHAAVRIFLNAAS